MINVNFMTKIYNKDTNEINRILKETRKLIKPKIYKYFINDIKNNFSIQNKDEIILISTTNEGDEIPINNQDDLEEYNNITKVYNFYLEEEDESLNLELSQNNYFDLSDENIEKKSKIFCFEGDNHNEFEYFCKTHNKFVCASCIVKIKKKGKGQHHDCDVCIIEDLVHQNIESNQNLDNFDNLLNKVKLTIDELKSTFRNRLMKKK